MNILSLFDGMSCGQIAFDKLGIKFDGKNNKYFASEIKDYAIKIVQHNYPGTIQIGDVRKVSYKNGTLHTENGDYKVNIDAIIGGSPCQSISLMNRKGKGIYQEDKSGYFWEYLRILQEVKPKYFLLENVVGRKDSIDAMSQWLATKPILIDSALVAPQQRRRYYWSNIYGITQPEDRGLLLKDTQTKEGDDDLKLYGSEKFQAHCEKKIKENKKFVTCGTEKAQCLLKSGIHKWQLTVFKTDKGYRKPTVTECEMWQTVPLGYTTNVPGLTDSQRYDVLGDGWTVDVIAHIFKGLKGEQ